VLKALADLVIPPWLRWAALALALAGAFGAGWRVAAWRAEAAQLAAVKAARSAERAGWEREVAAAKRSQADAELRSAAALGDVADARAEVERLKAALARGPLIEFREVPVREGETTVRVAARGARYRLCWNAGVSGAPADRAACEASGVHDARPAAGVPPP